MGLRELGLLKRVAISFATPTLRARPRRSLLFYYVMRWPAPKHYQGQSKDQGKLAPPFGSLLYNIECRTLFDLSYWDINGTPKIFPRSFDKLLQLTRDDDLIDAEFNLVCRRENYPVIEVQIACSFRRHGGRWTTNYSSALKLYWGAFQMWRDEHVKST